MKEQQLTLEDMRRGSLYRNMAKGRTEREYRNASRDVCAGVFGRIWIGSGGLGHDADGREFSGNTRFIANGYDRSRGNHGKCFVRT